MQQHQADKTIGMATYNIRGLATRLNEIGRHLQRLKELRNRGARDIIFLQETHLHADEHQAAAAQYAAMWGYKHTAAHIMSFWSSGSQRRAGVAILVNPYGAFKNVQPWKPESWTEHLIMVTGEVGNKTFLFMNLYAPSAGPARIQFFRRLQSIGAADGMTLVCGGDFNCVTNSVIDRYNSNKRADIGATELQRFVEQNGLIDAGHQTIPTTYSRRERREYASIFHTYRQTKADGQVSTSRLDRFYISSDSRMLIRGVEVEEPPCHTDHRGVLLELHQPGGPVRVRKRPKIYPPPHYAAAVTNSLVQERLMQLRSNIEADAKADPISLWGVFKGSITKEMVGLKRKARTRMTSGYRAKIKRLKQKLKSFDYSAEGLADAERKGTLAELRRVQARRDELRTRILINNNAWSSKASTKHFFRRICTKYGDNVIPTLVSKVEGSRWGVHDKAEIISETWESIFNGVAEQQDGVEAYLEKLRHKWSVPSMDDIDDDFTEAEVTAAIKRCKRGKACGPDDLNNDWYQDNVELLAPILTQIFNRCMATGITPTTFDDAFIFAISKGGNKSDPLNYRPIALLNTDYKIFTRVLAWRVRKYIDRVVHPTQFGFVPGKTIHDAIDLFEAAKVAAKQNVEMTHAQVLMLDFAKAYDSLDRNFLLKVLRAKGFPPKFLAVVAATHRNTKVQFMANGQLSRPAKVSSGIRQGCPLAPLLFIIAVDVLYDELEADGALRGIDMEAAGKHVHLLVAGYADDTAIYLQTKDMQHDAILAVERFSRMSGLRLNIRKSAAISLGGPSDTSAAEQDDSPASREEQQPLVEETESVRYLGHIAGTGDTTQIAWSKAFTALTTRLVLAVGKTNTAQQRAMIAAAIVVPKLMYVARHAWPTDTLICEADRRIRNFVWKSSFAVPDRAPAGWIAMNTAELDPKRGGIGLPNIRAELAALAAKAVTDWALAEGHSKQITGTLLQSRARTRVADLTPVRKEPGSRLAADLWSTGLAWTKHNFACQHHPNGTTKTELANIRGLLKHVNGLKTQWTAAGLRCSFQDIAQRHFRTIQSERQQQHGQFLISGLETTPVTEINLVDVRGGQRKWSHFRRFLPTVNNTNIGDILSVHWTATGEVTFRPIGRGLPLPSGAAHEFREVCLAIITTWPEVAFQPADMNVLRVHHQLQDPHHVFMIEANRNTVEHSWGATHSEVLKVSETETYQIAVARKLEVSPASVWITPTPMLQRLSPLWAGKRRWAQSRRQFRKAFLRRREKAALEARANTELQWHEQHAAIAGALREVTWRRLQHLQGVPAYQQQNFVRVKHNRLRLWNREETDQRCAACGTTGTPGTAHLVWECTAAKHFWDVPLRMWGMADSTIQEMEEARQAAVHDIFSLKLHRLPTRLVAIVQDPDPSKWDLMQKMLQDLWAMGCVATISAIWIWNVKLVHPDGRRQPSLTEAATRLGRDLEETIHRHRVSLFPLTPRSKILMDATDRLAVFFKESFNDQVMATTPDMATRVAFFDGGSRGNPGPGGSGSVIATLRNGRAEPIWAAATSLGQRATTNNVAEFVGLHRVLAKAAASRWTGIHVIGDSAMIIRMMRERKLPTNHKMQHWYRLCRRLADQCSVSTWTHHYRAHNKTADWLANVAMDTRVSYMVNLEEVDEAHHIRRGVQERIGADTQRWQENATADDTGRPQG